MDDVLGYAGRHVVVTGTASGMGETTARLLLELGATVSALDIKPTTVPVKSAYEIDLRDGRSIASAADRIDGPIDAVFSCAGLPGPPFSDVDVVTVNFIGARALIEALVPKVATGGAIACVSSAGGIGWQNNLPTLLELVQTVAFTEALAWLESHPESIGPSAYMFSKQAINAWTAWRASTLLRDRGIRLNCTNPGPTATPMMPFFQEIATKDVIDATVGPLGRYSEPIEQAWPLVFLNSPRASCIAGEVLFTDGGFFGALQTGQVDFSALTQ